MPEKVAKTLYIFIDESGDFNFSKAGSPYYILTSVSTLTPLQDREVFWRLKYDLLDEGIDKEFFHATEDEQSVRDRVFSAISQLSDIEVDSVIAQKNKVNFTLYEDVNWSSKGKGFSALLLKVEERFYKQLCETLNQYVVRRYVGFRSSNIKNIVIVLDRVFTGRKRDFVTKHLKQCIKSNFGIVPYVLFHQQKSDPNCQIADYCCWALSVKWSRKGKEMRPYQAIQPKIKSEFDIFVRGTTLYY